MNGTRCLMCAEYFGVSVEEYGSDICKDCIQIISEPWALKEISRFVDERDKPEIVQGVSPGAMIASVAEFLEQQSRKKS